MDLCPFGLSVAAERRSRSPTGLPLDRCRVALIESTDEGDDLPRLLLVKSILERRHISTPLHDLRQQVRVRAIARLPDLVSQVGSHPAAAVRPVTAVAVELLIQLLAFSIRLFIAGIGIELLRLAAVLLSPHG